MIKVTLVGKGTVSKHLYKAFSKAENIEVVQTLASRGEITFEAIEEESDIYIIAISDDAITSVSQQFIKSKKLIAHTSGSAPIDHLPRENRRGVFYPLQTFSKEREVDFKTIPICIEAERKEDVELLSTLANSISNAVYKISSEQRKSLHLAAVFVNNFTNHLYQIGNEICKKNKVPFTILKPLITETAAKLHTLSPIEAQTGPAMRNDQKTIAKQFDQLKNDKQKEVYNILTQSIIETYEKKL